MGAVCQVLVVPYPLVVLFRLARCQSWTVTEEWVLDSTESPEVLLESSAPFERYQDPRYEATLACCSSLAGMTRKGYVPRELLLEPVVQLPCHLFARPMVQWAPEAVAQLSF